MQQSGLSLNCFFFVTSFHSFSLVACSSGINIAWDEWPFVYASRFPEACVSHRQVSRAFWQIRNSRSSLNKTTCGVRTPFFQGSHLRISHSPDFEVYLKNFVSQMRCDARRDNMCLLPPSKMKWRTFLMSFHQNNFLREIAMKCRINSFLFLQYQKRNLTLPRMFWLLSYPSPASYISSRKSLVQESHEILRWDSLSFRWIPDSVGSWNS